MITTSHSAYLVSSINYVHIYGCQKEQMTVVQLSTSLYWDGQMAIPSLSAHS